MVHRDLCMSQQHLGSRTMACPSRNGTILLFSELRRPHLDTASGFETPTTGKTLINWCEFSGISQYEDLQ